MPHYLIRIGYPAEGWAADVDNPQDVRERAVATAEVVGGTAEELFYVFGDDA
jgi:hypothetical protein